MLSFKAHFVGIRYHLRIGKDSGIDTFLIAWKFTQKRQLLTACCDQNIAFCSGKIGDGLLHGMDEYNIGIRIDRRTIRSDDPYIRNVLGSSGVSDVLRDKYSVGMSRIQNTVKSISAHEILHLLLIESGSQYCQCFMLRQHQSAIICGNAYSQMHLQVFLIYDIQQKLRQFSAFCRSGKYEVVFHNDELRPF